MEKIESNNVHIWRLNLNWFDESQLFILSDDERNKVSRLVSLEHQQYAQSMRIQLRLLLACYLFESAKKLCFSKGPYGKPNLVNNEVFFNISHSKDCGLVAINRNNELGVDVECWRPIENMKNLVQRHFSEIERTAWNALSTCDQEPAFFKIWTCKEAFIKATGRGLGMGLSSFSFDIENAPHLVDCLPEYGPASDWSCASIDLSEKISGTVMVKSKNCDIIVNEFDPNYLPELDDTL